ncbi:MAG: Fe-S oxidoreductase [Deltaproteobacteria bacterium RIFOXYD12_FULL_57_12]|nr:MAG: Fe-S oxidoreductase [Deltaproteobacteria bacterium RIFOXYD12_FULL_57_12]
MSDTAKPSQDKSFFGFDKNPSNILPTKYTLDSKIKFRCHPGVPCFTQCCRDIKIVLTPYDILTLRRRLNMTAAEFLHVYTEPTYLQKVDFPGVIIKLNEQGICPFLKSAAEGCNIYTDRPTACRYYPVGMAHFHEGAQEEQTAEEFYFVVKEPHCKGFEEDKTWTIRDWRADQGVDLRDRMNKGWMEIVMRRKSFGFQATLSEQAKRMFFMTSTDLDQFRKFIFESSFLDSYEVDAEILERIRTDDVELMLFSFKLLAAMLFGTNDVKVKEEKLKAKIEEIKKKQEVSAKTMEEKADADMRDILAERERIRQETGK